MAGRELTAEHTIIEGFGQASPVPADLRGRKLVAVAYGANAIATPTVVYSIREKPAAEGGVAHFATSPVDGSLVVHQPVADSYMVLNPSVAKNCILSIQFTGIFGEDVPVILYTEPF